MFNVPMITLTEVMAAHAALQADEVLAIEIECDVFTFDTATNPAFIQETLGRYL